MDAIILAGGLGTRLRQVVSDVPKPLAPIGGVPFLDILLNQLDRFKQIHKVVLAVGYKAQYVLDYYRGCKKYTFDIDFSVEDSLLGTGGAIKQALPLTMTENVLVLNGDSFVEFDLADLCKSHRKHQASLTLVVIEVDDTSRYGSVEVDINTMRVIQFRGKGGTRERGYINAGCYLLERNLFDSIHKGQVFSFERQVLPSLLSNVYGYISRGKFIDIGAPESYLIANEYLRLRS